MQKCIIFPIGFSCNFPVVCVPHFSSAFHLQLCRLKFRFSVFSVDFADILNTRGTDSRICRVGSAILLQFACAFYLIYLFF